MPSIDAEKVYFFKKCFQNASFLIIAYTTPPLITNIVDGMVDYVFYMQKIQRSTSAFSGLGCKRLFPDILGSYSALEMFKKKIGTQFWVTIAKPEVGHNS